MKNAENIDFTVDIVYTVYREVIKILDEKIKVRVSDFLRQTLELDAIAFNFIKTNGEANLNLFLNKLIPNLLLLKKARREEILEYAKEQFDIAEDEADFTEKIVNGLNTIFESIYFSDSELDELTQVIWIRPSNDNRAVFDEIIESETEITGLEPSVYIRNLLNEFSRLPRYKKEQITFQEESEKTLLARDSGRELKFRYENEIHRAFVFACMYNYLQEQGNYVLCYDIGLNIICRYQISEITALHVLDKKYKPSDIVRELCNRYAEEGLWLDDEVLEVGGDA